MDVPAPFPGGRDSSFFVHICLSGVDALFFPSGAVRLAVGSGRGGMWYLTHVRIGFLWESFAVCWGESAGSSSWLWGSDGAEV